MVDTRPTGTSPHLPVRTDTGGGRTPAGRSVEEPRSHRSHSGRIPSLKQLAALLVDGVLTLPPYYRRGMYLDLLVQPGINPTVTFDSLRPRRQAPPLQMLSQKAKYALRALLMLAEQPDADMVMIADIAERENVPRKFLEAILLDLRKRGLLDSRRGKYGGYRLAKPADAISFGEIIRIVDGPLAPLPCASKSGFRPCEDCTDVNSCSVRWLMLQVRDATADILDNCSLADALKHRQATGLLPERYEI